MKSLSLFLKIAAILWILWGFVHMFAGAITMYNVNGGDVAAAVSGIADAVDPATAQIDYPPTAGAIIGQHGFNLFWIGLVTFVCAFFMWKRNKVAMFLAALTGGLADLGYFLYLDLGGFVNFMPGTVMTLVSSAAIVLSAYVYFKSDKFALFGENA